MFQKIPPTQYPPAQKPIMVWDGECGFCEYWIRHWQKTTGNKIDYRPYQAAATDFPDINRRHFMLASRLIETDGQIYSGPRSAYRSFTYGSKWAFLDRWYERKKWFQQLSDRLYRWVTRHRGQLFRLSKFMFGSNPESLKPFWAVYLLLIALFIYYLGI